MTSPSSTMRLSDQEYMELVFENGQILAKSQRPNNTFPLQNQRTQSIMDLYEVEYNEDYKKTIIKNLEDTQVVPNHDVVALDNNKRVIENKKNVELITPPDEHSMVTRRSVETSFDSTDTMEESEESMYLSSTTLDDVRPHVSERKRKRSKEVYNSTEQKQRDNIDKKMRTLQNLLPSFHKDDNESMLDEAINYMTTLQFQLQTMNNFVTPPMMFPLLPHYSHMGVPPFLNHPGLMPMQNCFPHFVPASYPAFPNQVSNSTPLSNLETATNNTTSQETLTDWKNSL